MLFVLKSFMIYELEAMCKDYIYTYIYNIEYN